MHGQALYVVFFRKSCSGRVTMMINGHKMFSVVCWSARATYELERKFTEEQVDGWMLPLSDGGSRILSSDNEPYNLEQRPEKETFLWLNWSPNKRT
jgi:hypothetical protein